MTTKKKPAAEAASETALSVRTSGGELATYDYGDHAKQGQEDFNSGDMTVPFLNQLQGLSNEVDEGEDSYVEGAKPGMFLNSVTKELHTGDVFLIPCYKEEAYVEWTPRSEGGGFVAMHAEDSDVVAEAKANATGMDLKTKDGNDLIFTKYLFCLQLPEEGSTDPTGFVVLSFTKTKLKRVNGWFTAIRTFKGHQNAPIFAHRIRLTSTREKNKAGQTYFNVNVLPAINGNVGDSMIPPTDEFRGLLEGAAAFRETVQSGMARANFDSAENESTGGGSASGGEGSSAY